jgi:hypothetical protein
MRTLCFLSCFAPCLLALTGCAGTSSFVHSDATLGRVVVYRNGIAYFERTAHLEGDSLRLAVPADKVDDFLKSLTVVDAKTGEPAPIAYPTSGQPNESGLIDMKIALTGPSSHDLRLSYVTEAPSWKPSYRLQLGKDGKVSVQAWAIVDNTSGEDWQNVQLGVGSSSALSFRFDLRSVRLVQRETLQQTDLFAQAPPTGGAAYGQQLLNNNGTNGQPPPAQPPKRMVVELSEEALQAASTNRNAPEPQAAIAANRKEAYKAPPPAKPAEARALRGAEGGAHASGAKLRAFDGPSGYSPPAAYPPPADKTAPPAVQAQVNQLDAMAKTIQQTNKNFVVEGYADGKDGDKYAASLERANRAREQLIRNGVDPSRVVAVGSGEKAGHKGGVSILEATTPVSGGDGSPDVLVQKTAQALGTDPIGTSHFESKARMTVPRGTSAMVSILSTDTAGEVVYFFDAESPRGNGTYPFRAVRVKNPTDSVLEQGPTFVLNNRLGERATVYVRHTVAEGYKLTKAPSHDERLGAAHLFRVDVEPGSKAELTIEESTPLFKSTDIRSPSGMEMVTAYLSSEAASGPLKAAMGDLLKLHREMANTEQQIGTMREQMEEYRARMDELHAQIVTLKAVKTAGPLMANLEKKLQEVSDKLSKATIDLVALQEKLMVARIKFQDGVADLSLEKKTEPSPPTKS